MRLEQIVEPGRPGAFFEGHGQSSTQSRQELQNGCGFGFQDGFHDYLALRIHHRYADRCLMNVEPNILFTVHKGAPFPRWWCDNHNLLQEGRPFIMRLRQQLRKAAGDQFLRRLQRYSPNAAIEPPAIKITDPNQPMCRESSPNTNATVKAKIMRMVFASCRVNFSAGSMAE